MTAIAENDGANTTSGVLNAWQGLLARIDAELRQLAAHPARSVVLLPLLYRRFGLSSPSPRAAGAVSP